MNLKYPACICSNLCAGVRVGSGEITIEYAGDCGGRTCYRWSILADGWEETGDDLQSGVGGGNLRDGLVSLLSFLSACAESRQYMRHSGDDGENADLFSARVGAWAEQNSDAIQIAQLEVEETPDCIEE